MQINEFIKKINSKKLLVVGLIITIVSIAFGTLFYFMLRGQEAVYLDKVEGTYEYAKVDVSLLDNYFASEKTDTDEKKYYLAYDIHELPYIIVLNDENYELLKDIQDYSLNPDKSNVSAPAPVTVYGNSAQIPEEAYKYLKEFLNTGEEDTVSLEEIKNAVGSYYLDTYYNPNEDVTFWVIIWSIFGGLGLILIITYFIRFMKTKQKLSISGYKIENIINDVNQGAGTHNAICKVFLTNKYVASYATSLKIIEIKDIIWIYPFEIRQNGLVTNKSIYVITNNGKSNVLVSVSYIGKKRRLAYEEVYQELMNRTPNALHGYSKENQEKAKEMYKR